MRQERSRHLIVELEAWLREQRAELSRNNETTKAINYCLSRWEGFSGFLDDGRLCMSNNAAERELRVVAVGREKIGPSPGPTRAAGVRPPSTASSPPPSSMTSTYRRAYRITLPSALTNCCLGIGGLKASLTLLNETSAQVLDPGRGFGRSRVGGRIPIVGEDRSLHPEPVRRTGLAFADASN